MSSSADVRALPTAVARPSIQWTPVAAALATIALAAAYIGQAISARQAALFLVGVAAGVTLYHASFGFTSAWRAFIVERRGDGVRAQMLMLAVTCLIFFPAIGAGQLFGQPVRGSISPVGFGVVVGAFMFGVGMQLGGGCASGTLFTVGGGNSRMLVTLGAFIVGSVAGATHMSTWEALPALKPASIVVQLGPGLGLLVSLAAFAGIAGVTIAAERRRHGTVAYDLKQPSHGFSALRGPWPLVAGAVGLAAVNIATLVLAGRPWGVTSAFVLWGGKLLQFAGADLHTWSYYASAARQAELGSSVLRDITSVMDFGLILGALAAATAAGRFAPKWRVSGGSFAAAVLGGLLLGYGARIAYGCNIGAFFSGIASGSLHGWLWFPCALAGNFVGTRLRPAFGLSRR